MMIQGSNKVINIIIILYITCCEFCFLQKWAIFISYEYFIIIGVTYFHELSYVAFLITAWGSLQGWRSKKRKI